MRFTAVDVPGSVKLPPRLARSVILLLSPSLREITLHCRTCALDERDLAGCADFWRRAQNSPGLMPLAHGSVVASALTGDLPGSHVPIPGTWGTQLPNLHRAGHPTVDLWQWLLAIELRGVARGDED